MHLLVPHLTYRIPVTAAPDDTQLSGPMIDVPVPTNDPRGLPLTPKMRATLVRDDGQSYPIILGSTWTTHQKGSVMRIPYTEATDKKGV